MRNEIYLNKVRRIDIPVISFNGYHMFKKGAWFGSAIDFTFKLEFFGFYGAFNSRSK
jgi:hypothetical protein